MPDVARQIEDADPTVPDIICFNGLTNDAWQLDTLEHMGKLSAAFDGDFDRTTFYGAFERVCFLLRNKYRDSAIFFVCSHKMPTRDMRLQELLQRAAREVCEKWSIPYVDVYRQGQINTCIKGMRMGYSYDTADCLTGGNGTHLNATGYKKWYLPMLETAMGAYL